MSIQVLKNNSGATFYQSGPISFSSLRSNFNEDNPYGQIRISEYRRNTNSDAANPIVPDSTENENISPGNDLRIGGFRNSVKRYFAFQRDIDDNSANPDNPGLRMGRVDSSGKGIDWSGGGYSGRDGYGGTDPYNSNISKNIQKIIHITGTCGSTNTSRAAAQLSPAVAPDGPAVPVNNVTIFVEGSILGAGGAPGQNGGDGLRIIGTSNCKIIMNGGVIYAGGGGGGRGRDGNRGSDGLCYNLASYENGGVCGSCPGCGADREYYCYAPAPNDCNCHEVCVETYIPGQAAFWCDKKGNCYDFSTPDQTIVTCQTVCDGSTYYSGCIQTLYSYVSGGEGGAGGSGGRGQGYGQSRTAGSPGSPGGTSSCGGAYPYTQYSSTGETGGDGGSGGDWGEPGQGGGSSGIALYGTNYSLSGNNAYNIRGSYSPPPSLNQSCVAQTTSTNLANFKSGTVKYNNGFVSNVLQFFTTSTPISYSTYLPNKPQFSYGTVQDYIGNYYRYTLGRPVERGAILDDNRSWVRLFNDNNNISTLAELGGQINYSYYQDYGNGDPEAIQVANYGGREGIYDTCGKRW